MSFLQPWMLAAIPLAAIPIIIHLVNQRRFQTVPWAAMRFLLEAKSMSSGYTRLRQWLILAMRTLAILALVLFTARPLTSGILAVLGGESDMRAIVVLDRSPSMGDRLPGSNRTRLETAIDQLASTLETLGVQRIVQIDEASGKPEEFRSLNQWLRSVPRTPWSASSDIPGMLEQALVYAKNNPAGNSVVWIGSDLRESDWRTRDGRWAAVRDGFRALAQNIRFSILDLSSGRTEDRSIRISQAQTVDIGGSPMLSVSFRVDRLQGDRLETSLPQEPKSIPIEIAIGSSRTSLDLAWTGTGSQVNDYRLPLPNPLSQNTAGTDSANSDGDRIRGWGWVKLPNDANPTNDVSYFVYEQPPLRRTLIVSDRPEWIDAIELCASIAPQQTVRCETERITQAQLGSVALDTVALLVWHDSLPTGASLRIVEAFVQSGGHVLLVPPENPDANSAFGFQWLAWREVGKDLAGDSTDSEPESRSLARIAQWQNDSELLANTLNGAPLPLGQLGIRRLCTFAGSFVPLANLSDGQPILATLDDNQGSVRTGSIVVCATTPTDRDSTLAGDGVVLYVAIQRLLADGAKRVASIRQGIAGVDRGLVDANAQWKAGEETASSTQYPMYAGVYDASNALVALDRGLAEDEPTIADEGALSAIFGDLSWSRVEAGGRTGSLVQEVWRWFLAAMLAALLLEALLCLPRMRRSPSLAGSQRT